MSKTYYLGETKAGAFVGRGSGSDYGYTHAAVLEPSRFGKGAVVGLHSCNFSRSAEGARKGAEQNWNVRKGAPYELVELKTVSAKAYKAATGKS